jgi:hypothetical protein
MKRGSNVCSSGEQHVQILLPLCNAMPTSALLKLCTPRNMSMGGAVNITLRTCSMVDASEV